MEGNIFYRCLSSQSQSSMRLPFEGVVILVLNSMASDCCQGQVDGRDGLQALLRERVQGQLLRATAALDGLPSPPVGGTRFFTAFHRLPLWAAHPRAHAAHVSKFRDNYLAYCWLHLQNYPGAGDAYWTHGPTIFTNNTILKVYLFSVSECLLAPLPFSFFTELSFPFCNCPRALPFI